MIQRFQRSQGMFRTKALCLLTLAFVLGPPIRHISAQDEDAKAVLRVGIKSAEPFVMLDPTSGEPKGFSIDLINAIASQMTPPRRVQFVVQADIDEHLEAVRRGDVDLGIAATSFSSERQRILDFSIPFYHGGLGIATRADGRGLRLRDIVTSSELRFIFLWLILFLIICAHVIWLTERGQTDTFDDRWHVGVGQAIWWTIVTMSTVGYGDFVPRRPISRLIGVLIIVTGIVLFGVAVGAFSSALTLNRLTTDIQGPDDLRNKPVAVIQNTIGARALQSHGALVMKMANVADALAAVEQGDVVAAVHDVAVLRYHVPRNAPQLTLVGPTFSERGYGITFPLGSELRKDVNVALLELMEGDPPRYGWMLDQWFDTP